MIEVLLRGHGGDGGATAILVGATTVMAVPKTVMAVPRRPHCGFAQPAVALRKF